MIHLTLILLVVGIIALAVVICGLSGAWEAQKSRKRYQKIQTGRLELSDAKFCSRAGLPVQDELLASSLRKSFAKFNGFEALKIYPDDPFFEHFGIQYDDDLAMFLHDEKILNKLSYSFPCEDLKIFSDLVPTIKELNSKVDQGAAPRSR